MNHQLLDLYSDYLLSSFSKVTATGMSDLLDGIYSHDQITRFLRLESLTQKELWLQVKPLVRRVEQDDSVLIADDTIEMKPYTDENNIVCWHFDHCHNRSVKGINILNFLHHTNLEKDTDMSIPVSFEIVSKTEFYEDAKTNKTKRRSPVSKNELFRNRLKILTKTNKLKFKYVLFDIWFSAKENFRFIKQELKKDAIGAIKSNRTVAVSKDDKMAGQFVKISELDIHPGQVQEVYLKGLNFPVSLVKQVFTNEDGSTGILYLVSTDMTLTYDQITTIYKKRWKVETFHKSTKQNAALEHSPTKTETSQKNHIVAALIAFVKLEQLKLNTKLNHFALKSKLYLKALQTSYNELKKLTQNNIDDKLVCQAQPVFKTI